jgi:hypothetical protein
MVFANLIKKMPFIVVEFFWPLEPANATGMHDFGKFSDM